LRSRLGLAQKACANVSPERELWRQQFDGDPALESLVARAVDNPHAATSDLLIHLIGGGERLLDVRAEFGVLGGLVFWLGHSLGIEGVHS